MKFAIPFLLTILFLAPAFGQAPMVVTPANATLIIGQSQPFQAVDPSGHLLSKVSWTISGPGISQSHEGSEVIFTAPSSGEFQIIAHANGDSAEASIKVLSGTSIPYGTAKWTAPAYPGCKISQIVPAVPNSSGIDVYSTDICPDGTYISAFTEYGIQKWRHKIGDTSQAYAVPLFADKRQAATAPASAVRLNVPITSFCDRVSVGTKQADLRDMLAAGHWQPAQENAGAGSWLIEEQNSQCRIWFDGNSMVTRKQKILVAQ